MSSTASESRPRQQRQDEESFLARIWPVAQVRFNYYFFGSLQPDQRVLSKSCSSSSSLNYVGALESTYCSTPFTAFISIKILPTAVTTADRCAGCCKWQSTRCPATTPGPASSRLAPRSDTRHARLSIDLSKRWRVHAVDKRMAEKSGRRPSSLCMGKNHLWRLHRSSLCRLWG